MYVRDRVAGSNLLRSVYRADRELSHLVVLPKSASGLAADALNCSRARLSQRPLKPVFWETDASNHDYPSNHDYLNSLPALWSTKPLEAVLPYFRHEKGQQ